MVDLGLMQALETRWAFDPCKGTSSSLVCVYLFDVLFIPNQGWGLPERSRWSSIIRQSEAMNSKPNQTRTKPRRAKGPFLSATIVTILRPHPPKNSFSPKLAMTGSTAALAFRTSWLEASSLQAKVCGCLPRPSPNMWGKHPTCGYRNMYKMFFIVILRIAV